MKFRHSLIIGCLTALLGVGAFVGLNVNKEAKIEMASADNHTQNPTIYFVPHDQWVLDGNERFKMNYYDWDTYKGELEMELYGISNVPGRYYNRKIYKAVVTDGSWVSRVQFFRMSSSYVQENYSSQIYLTENNDNNVLMTNEDLDYWNNWTVDTPGVWFDTLVHNAIYKTTDQAPSSTTGRVFFYNSGTHWADNNYAGCAVYAWGGSASPKLWSGHSEQASATIYNFTWFKDDNNTSYGYADIPTDITGYKFCRITEFNTYYTSTGYFSDNEFIPDSFAYLRKGRGSGNTIDSGGAISNVAGANLMTKIIEAYSTCKSSVLNGYGAYVALNNNFYSHATAAAKAATAVSLGGKSATIQEHFEGMEASYNHTRHTTDALVLPPNVNGDSTTTTMIAVLATTIALVAAAGFVLIKKKKSI